MMKLLRAKPADKVAHIGLFDLVYRSESGLRPSNEIFGRNKGALADQAGWRKDHLPKLNRRNDSVVGISSESPKGQPYNQTVAASCFQSGGVARG